MLVFVVNCGSSSIKYQLFDMADESERAGGMLERVGGDAVLHHSWPAGQMDRPVEADSHTAGMHLILEALVDPAIGVIGDVGEIAGVGHRVVHGGEHVSGSVRIDESVLAVIRRNAELAPLHNPPNLAGIEAALEAIGHCVQVAVFDTAFFATLPPVAFRYAVPEAWYREHHVRRYGFHGTSHRYVTARAAELLGKAVEQVHLITAHLGNGCSMTAVAGGRAVDHSMGMTPLEGLMMGTRSGDVDPAVIPYMVSRGLSVEQVDDVLNGSSGLLGVSGLSNDMRDLEKAAAGGDERARLAREMFVYRVAKYVGAYRAVLGELDAVVLTGGIGENAASLRADLCRRLAHLGAAVDEGRNGRTVGGRAGPITADDAQMPVWVIPTNEELMIARDTMRFVQEGA